MRGEIRIGEGGLLHRVEAAARLTSLSRQLVTVLSITWLPVMVLGLATQWLTGQPEPIIRDVSEYSDSIWFMLVDPRNDSMRESW